MKPKYSEDAKLCNTDTYCFIIHIKTEDFYEDIVDDVKNVFDTSNYECNRPLPMGENKKAIGLMKDELGGKIMTEFVGLRAKNYSHLRDEGNTDKKSKGTNKCITEREFKFQDYK